MLAPQRSPTCGPCAPLARKTAAVSGSLRLNPLWRRTDKGAPLTNTVVQIAFDATVPATGMNCSGTVDVCAIPGGRQTGSKQCAAFNSTGVSFNALSCLP